MVPNEQISPLFDATAWATEEAIVNALVAAETMTGADGRRVERLPHDATAVGAGHGLGGDHRVDDRLFGRLHRGLEDSR